MERTVLKGITPTHAFDRRDFKLLQAFELMRMACKCKKCCARQIMTIVRTTLRFVDKTNNKCNDICRLTFEEPGMITRQAQDMKLSI